MTFDDLRPGMKVYIRDDLEYGEVYGSDRFITNMMRGICEVDYILKPINKFLVCDSYGQYTPEMVDWDKTEELNRTLEDIDELEDIDKVVEAGNDILSIAYKSDAIKPNHYKMNIKGTDIETRDIMQAVATEEEYNGFLYCNVIKYVLRAKRKNGIEDMKKAKLYLEWLIEGREE